MKTNYRYRLAAIAIFLVFAGFAFATSVAFNSSNTFITDSGPGRLETLSGISLIPVRETGTFQLQFNNALPENGILEVKNAKGLTVYSRPLLLSENSTEQAFNVGKLQSGVYLIEVKAGNTIYWKKVRIRK